MSSVQLAGLNKLDDKELSKQFMLLIKIMGASEHIN